LRATKSGLCIGVMALMSGALLAGCSQAPPPSPTPTSSAPVLNVHAQARQLAVGDCFDAADLARKKGKRAIRSCTAVHENEVYARVSLGAAEARPDDDRLQASASKQCLEAFSSYVGSEFNRSALGYSYLYPSVDAWPLGDHDAVCYLVNHGKRPLTRSMRHSGV